MGLVGVWQMMNEQATPIFADPTGRRKRVTNLFGGMLIIAATMALIGLLVALIHSPVLPSLEHAAAVVEDVLSAKAPATTGGLNVTSQLPTLFVASSLSQNALRFAFVQSGDSRSIGSLKENASHLDAIIVDWLGAVSPDGKIALRNSASIATLREWMRQTTPHLAIFPLISEEFVGRKLAAVLASADLRRRLVGQIGEFVRSHDLSGVTFAPGQMPSSSHYAIASFLSDLRAEMRTSGGKVIIQLPNADVSSHDVELANIADYALLTLYEDTYATPAAQPLAPQSWFEAKLHAAIRRLDRTKLIVGIGAYAKDTSDAGIAQSISIQTAWDLMARSGAELLFDANSLNPHLMFEDGRRTKHTVWLLDAVTGYNQGRVALSIHPAGISLWRLGLEEPSVWDVIGRSNLPKEQLLDPIKVPQPANDVVDHDKGAVFSISDERKPGKRNITVDPRRNLIVDEKLIDIPKSRKVESWGQKNQRRVALTFDDGPDAVYTPEVLDILKEKKVPATFFIIGQNALQNPNLMWRLYAEGHEIGNHTFTHPNLAGRSTSEAEFELNATQHVIESQLRIRTALFRAPYNIDDVLTNQDGLDVLDVVSKLGYVNVRVTVDPNDWANPTSKQIVNRILKQIASKEDDESLVVLLHDSGGSRRSTITALPMIIDELHKRNYKFALVSDLLGVSRDEVMQSIHAKGIMSVALAELTGTGLGWVSFFVRSMPVLAIVTAVIGILRLAVIIVFALHHCVRERDRRALKWRPKSLSILVPAFNEDKVICKTIRSLLVSRWRKFDIIVIDDGSSDETAEVVRRMFWKTRRVKVFKKENGGKSAALNFGLRQTNAEIVIALDADTIFEPGAIEKLVRHFVDPNVGAVAGRAVVGNEVSLMARFQSLEYVSSQNLDRRAFERFNAIGVVPGAIGAWRREGLIEAGGFPHDTLAEDADATVALERRGWKVLYEPAAVAMTEAPETVRAFLKQRFRWMYGTLQVAFKHRGALKDRSAPGVRFITIPNIIIFQFLFTLLAPIMDLLLVMTLLVGLREWVLTGGLIVSDSLIKVSVYWAVFQSIDAVLAALAIRLNGERRAWSLFPLIFIQRFCYRQLLYAVAIRTLLAAIKGQFVGWGKLLRTGNVQEIARRPVPMSEAAAPA